MPPSIAASETRWGWTAGAGVEYALNENLSAKLEYDFLGFGTKWDEIRWSDQAIAHWIDTTLGDGR